MVHLLAHFAALSSDQASQGWNVLPASGLIPFSIVNLSVMALQNMLSGVLCSR